MHPADEFAEIRSQIARLEARSKALRAAFLSGAVPLTGKQAEIVVARRSQRTFQRSRLPEHILASPDLWGKREVVYVTARSLTEKPTGEVTSRVKAGPVSAVSKSVRPITRQMEDDECVVIEPF
ncbi:hypothetical protein [Marinibacterium profundimaris]|uniref:hypothetical protein n=1 Tax=Marinibacterium profundimaris TaxID=1679460 RepID=UPI000B52631C|nr:hypothetical protein [Marinibacterium profundimaris]